MISIVTLFPYEFDFVKSFEDLKNSTSPRYENQNDLLIDIILNIILFVPFGFALTANVLGSTFSKRASIVLVLLSGLGLSTCIECVQIFISRRFPSFVDLITNTAGSFVGHALFRKYGRWLVDSLSKTIHRSNAMLSTRILILMMLLLIGLLAYSSLGLKSQTKPTGWDADLPLIIGNELTGDKPWHGEFFAMKIYDKVPARGHVLELLHEESHIPSLEGHLICAYDFENSSEFIDKTGKNSAFEWTGENGIVHLKSGAVLSANRWLRTVGSAPFVAQAIAGTGQFTLSLEFATLDLEQMAALPNGIRPGPGRILSYSFDQYRRNFTLGQEGRNLVFRIRTPLTGENGQNPEFIVPDFFLSMESYHVIITYNGSRLNIFSDHSQSNYEKELSQGAVFFGQLISLNAQDLYGYKVIFCLNFFLLIGVLAMLLLRRVWLNILHTLRSV
jgi:VanZ family protein